MDEIKIQNFAKANPGKRIPNVRHLDRDECESLRADIAVKLGQPRNSDSFEVLQELELRSQDLPGKPSDDNFRLLKLFQELQLNARSVYVNWSSFDDMDEMSAKDLSDDFHDLWYPSSDDVEIFDRSMDWILLVRHYDVVQIVRLTNK